MVQLKKILDRQASVHYAARHRERCGALVTALHVCYGFDISLVTRLSLLGQLKL